MSGIDSAFVSVSDFSCYIVQKILAANTAVLTFFVLSGFVLAHSLLTKPTSYAGFAIKRVFRIYPVFVFSVLLSCLLHLLFDGHAGLFIEDNNAPALSLSTIVRTLVLWRTGEVRLLDRPMWSLVHEMRISLAFPIILMSVRKYGWRTLPAFLALSLACTILELHLTGSIATGKNDATLPQSLLSTGFFTVFFVAGASLAVEGNRIARVIAGLSHGTKTCLFVIMALCLLKSGGVTGLKDSAILYMNGIGALGVIALSLGGGAFKALMSHALPIWLGRVSYSLYLIHIPLMYAVCHIGTRLGVQSNAVTLGLALILTLVLSFGAAELMTRIIELPMVRYGKKLSAHVAASPVFGLVG